MIEKILIPIVVGVAAYLLIVRPFKRHVSGVHSNVLKGKKIAILATDGFEESELAKPRQSLLDAGAEVFIVSPNAQHIKSWDDKNWGKNFTVDIQLSKAKPQDFDGLLLPGGVINPDTLRITPGAITFVESFVHAQKPIAAICHGPWTLIDAEALKGRTVTSWPSIKQDLINAGAHWVDKEVVIDGNIVTSRNPGDIPAFTKAVIEQYTRK